MPFQISPGVNVTEKDLTNIVPAVATTIGGIAGYFQWGPCEERVLVDSEDNLVTLFGKPNNNTAEYFWTAANFLGYTNALQVVRKIDTDGANAVSIADGLRGDTAIGNTGDSKLIKNKDSYDDTYSDGISGGDMYFAAKYPGILGSSLKVSMSDKHTAAFTGITATVDTAYVDVTGLDIKGEVAVGDILKLDSNYTVSGFSGGSLHANDSGTAASHSTETAEYTHIHLSSDILSTDAGTGLTGTVTWAYASNFNATPDTSTDAAKFNAVNDEIDIAVIDEQGLFSGAKGTVLETFSASKASDAKKFDGSGNFYKTVINNESKYIWWGSHPSTALTSTTGLSGGTDGTDWGASLADVDSGSEGATFDSFNRNFYSSLANGHDGTGTTAASLYTNGYELFADAETVDCALLLGGPAEETLSGQLIDLVDARKDCVAFLSPPKADVVNQTSVTVAQQNAVDYYNNDLNKSSSYGVFDCGWKYQYDRYNDIYRWIPLNGDIAGLCARTEKTNDAWWSPAGFNRGQIRNIVKLAYNPRKAHRDNLYKNNLNPVVAFPGEGTVLFGDKTMQRKPSAFDRINVRRLFIVLEKAISTASKYQLFEFNDEFTRSNFVNMVSPFLRDVQGRRGIYDYKVVCDETNNTAEVIDRNEFVADIYIKPARSINFIQLNFVAVRTGVAFEEIAGA
jgi:phage tail sheath protein FI